LDANPLVRPASQQLLGRHSLALGIPIHPIAGADAQPGHISLLYTLHCCPVEASGFQHCRDRLFSLGDLMIQPA